MKVNRRRMIAVLVVMALCAMAVAAQNLDDWEIMVTGFGTKSMSYPEIVSSMGHSVHDSEMFLDLKGVEHKFEGIPFRHVVAMVDGEDSSHPYEFDIDFWVQGYEITLAAADGYSATFLTADVNPDGLLLAIKDNGEQITPRLVGDLPRSAWVSNLVRITLGVEDQTAGAAFENELVLQVNEMEEVFTIPELEKSAYYVEGPGSYTTSAGTTVTSIWGGIRFGAFVRAYFRLSPDNTVTMVAIDGNEMSYSGEEVLDDSNGFWIIAFKQDGEYIPVDPGPFKTIKIGPGTPNIPGHSSVSMIKRIMVSAKR